MTVNNNLPLTNFNPNEFDDTFDETFEEKPQSTEVVSNESSTSDTADTLAADAAQSVNGVSLDDLDITDEPEQTETATEEEKPVGYEQFSKDFEKYLGINLEGAKALLAELQTFRVETLVEKQQAQLKSKWGGDYEARFESVKEYFAKLPPAKQQALDNVEGAELIWAKIERDQASARANSTPNVPNYVSGRTATTTQRISTGNKAVLNYSDIVNMSPSEYRARQVEIQKAFEENRVNMDMDDSPF
jgi:hypothetical protein